MRLDERVRGGDPIVSFEFSPPRTVEAELALWAGLCVLAAAYPEPHPDSRGLEADMAHARAKVEAGVRALVSRASIPVALRRKLEARQDDPRAVAELGVADATAQAAELLGEGAPGVHLNTLNRSPTTRAIVSALRAHGALPAAVAG